MALLRSSGTLLCLLLLLSSCSDASHDAANRAPTPEEIAAQTDRACADILKSSNNMVAESWLATRPRSVLARDAAGQPVHLSPIVTRLMAAGAVRVVVQFSGLERDARILALVVVLPADAPSRLKVFALDPELGALAGQPAVTDVGQKHLLYTFD